MTILEILCKTLVELSKLSAAPGERSHMIAVTTDFIKKRIKEELQNERNTRI